MSVEEDVELKDLVAQTLETNGCLAKIRAQLRASIFLALDEDVKLSKQQPLLNNKVKTHLETDEGKAMFCVVREFLDYFNLYFTISVFEPESYLGRVYQYEGREKVAKDLGLDSLEDTTVPLLLQLIRIAQTKAKTIDIDLNFNSNRVDENKSASQEIDTANNAKKTESNNVSSNSFINDNEKSSGGDRIFVENNSLDPEKLNATYDLSSPIFTLHFARKIEDGTNKLLDEQNGVKEQILDSTYSKRDGKDDDTYEDTSSIAEDSVALINLDSTRVSEISVNGIDKVEVNEAETPQPVVKECKILDKPKLSTQKSEKIKSKSSLSSLADLPSLQINKPRANDILPSLYSKEFKDKSNLHELDKLFDMDADYEEDFMCSGDDLSLKSDCLRSDHSKINLLEDLPHTRSDKASVLGKSNAKQSKIPSRVISDCNKPLSKLLVNSQKSKDLAKCNDVGIEGQNGSSNSSVSEHLEIATLD